MSRAVEPADLVELAQMLPSPNGGPAIEDRAVREKIAEWHATAAGVTYTRFRIMTALSKGQTPGAGGSIGKVVSASLQQQIASFGMDMLGMGGGVMQEELAPMYGLFQNALLSSPGMRIAGRSRDGFCATSSGSGCSACPAMCAWTRTCRSTGCRAGRGERGLGRSAPRLEGAGPYPLIWCSPQPTSSWC
ncbi:MAG: acyl-CoA dehydrogenase family protein [Acetobacteraceae bacterium]